MGRPYTKNTSVNAFASMIEVFHLVLGLLVIALAYISDYRGNQKQGSIPNTTIYGLPYSSDGFVVTFSKERNKYGPRAVELV